MSAETRITSIQTLLIQWEIGPPFGKNVPAPSQQVKEREEAAKTNDERDFFLVRFREDILRQLVELEAYDECWQLVSEVRDPETAVILKHALIESVTMNQGREDIVALTPKLIDLLEEPEAKIWTRIHIVWSTQDQVEMQRIRTEIEALPVDQHEMIRCFINLWKATRNELDAESARKRASSFSDPWDRIMAFNFIARATHQLKDFLVAFKLCASSTAGVPPGVIKDLIRHIALSVSGRTPPHTKLMENELNQLTAELAELNPDWAKAVRERLQQGKGSPLS